jgi:uncharacterized membrane protein YccF (DUF307 family)
MNRSAWRLLSLSAVLAFSSIALAQDDGTTATSALTFVTYLGPIAAIIWFILFVRWGGLRWFY